MSARAHTPPLEVLTTDRLRAWLDTTGRPGPVAPPDLETFIAVLIRDGADDPGDAEILPGWEARARPGVVRWAPLPTPAALAPRCKVLKLRRAA